MFIATANSLDTISAPLLDRCEIIHLSGTRACVKRSQCSDVHLYPQVIHTMRRSISRKSVPRSLLLVPGADTTILSYSKRYLIPKQLKINGLPVSEFEISEEALQHIASRYSREAGVRTLERQIGSVVRYKAVQWSDSRDPQTGASSTSRILQPYKKLVEAGELQTILGLEWYHPEEREITGKRGIVNGLVVQGEGEGGILSVETLLIPGTGRLRLTGSLGDVIKESGELALSWVLVIINSASYTFS